MGVDGRPKHVLEARLHAIWCATLATQNIAVGDSFVELGGDSRTAGTLCARLREAFGLDIPLSVVVEHPTIERMAGYLRQRDVCTSSSLLPIQPHGSLPPLFCVHPLLGAAHCYDGLSQHLGPEQPVIAFQSRGFDSADAPLRTIEAMAAEYLREMRTMQAHGPYQIAGLSMGVTVVFEMARQLTAAGEALSLVALLDGKCLEDGDAVADVTDDDLIRAEVPFMLEDAEHFAPGAAARFKDLDQDQQIERMLRIFAHVGTAPKGVTVDQFRRVLLVRALNRRARSAYRAQPYDGDVTLVTSSLASDADPAMGWRRFVRGRLDVDVIPGTHASCMWEPGVAALAALLKNRMAQSIAGSGARVR